MNNALTGVIIGAGHFADIQLEAWKSVKGAQIKGILNRTREKAEVLAVKYGLTVFDDFEEMIFTIKPDFVDICTPPDSHLYYSKLTADMGISVLCQKPVAPSMEESKELINYCFKKNVNLMINENWRWQPWYREIKKIIESGKLGEVYTVYSAMRPGDGWGTNPYPIQPYFKDMEQFLLYETGIHYIDTLRFLFGEIESVYCQLKKVNPLIAGEDLAIVQFNFENDMVGIYDANRTTYMEEERCPTYGWMTIEGTAGKLCLDEYGNIYYTPRDGQEQKHSYFISEGWMGGCATAAQQHFIDGLLLGIPFESSGDEYLKSIHTVYACYESAHLNQVVKLKEWQTV